MSGTPDFMDVELKELDPELAKLIEVEDMRQDNKIILIASESLCSRAVREALATSFTNIYAEGYPSTRMCVWEKDQLADHARHLSFYRRYADNRYYKGVDIIDLMESLAQVRCAEVFANEHARVEDIYVNVQPLSGAAANNAVYNAFLEPGDTVMGMDLTAGGHLTHGSPVNRSGKNYTIVPYAVDGSGRIDYGDMERKALEHRPKLIISGFSAYPWSVDWHRLRKIADSCGAILLADVSHVAGLIIAGEYPNPVGIADVTTFTTHKTLLGPRGACIITTNREHADLINLGVFPGEQGGPHENNIAAKAVAFGIAKTPEFREIQRRIVLNARALAEGFVKRGIGLAYGGTDTHFLMVDLKSLKPMRSPGPMKSQEPMKPLKSPGSPSGHMLNGEIVSRILEICGIVCNKNTVFGDDKAAYPSGLRLGTPIITQRGLDTDDMDELADIITTALKGMEGFSYVSKTGEPLGRTRIEYAVLEQVKERVHALTEKMGRCAGDLWDYPYFYSEQDRCPTGVFLIRGERSHLALAAILGIDVITMEYGVPAPAFVSFDGRAVHGEITLVRQDAGTFMAVVTGGDQARILTWFRALSDGYLTFDEDIMKKIDGPFVVEESLDTIVKGRAKGALFSFTMGDDMFSVVHPISGTTSVGCADMARGRTDGLVFDGSLDLLAAYHRYPDRFFLHKPYFIGQRSIETGLDQLPPSCTRLGSFEWKEPASNLQRSCLYDEHVKLGAAMVPFAGWEMPVKYADSIAEEHETVRRAAGLFDVSHMGVFGFNGKEAARFLDTITSNFVIKLRPGEAQYSYLLGEDGIPIDDIYVYMLDRDDYMMVVNAANIEKDRTWITGLLERRYSMDRSRPHVTVEEVPVFRDLKDPSCGADTLVDIAFQGPMTRPVMSGLLPHDTARKTFMTMKGSELFRTTLDGIPVIITRTGYTGEEFGYELFVHPEKAALLWNTILDTGKDLGVRPVGLGARDSTRVEAGFPLYGHELAGPYAMTPHGAGYGYFVKYHKPFFAGRDPLQENERSRELGIARIRVEKGAQILTFGDYVVNKNGKCIGYVTSSAVVRNRQVALAYVKKANITSPGTSVGLIPASRVKRASVGDVTIGTTLLPAIRGEIVPRFFNKRNEWPELYS